MPEADRQFSGTIGAVGGIVLGQGATPTVLSADGSGGLVVTSGNSVASQAALGAAFGPPMTSGRWYIPFNSGGLTTGAMGANSQVIYVPILFGRSCTLNGWATEVTSAGEAGSFIRSGLYTDNQGMPGTLVSEVANTDATLVQITTTVVSIPVTAGWYWYAIAAQNCPTTRPTVRVPQAPIGARTGGTSAGGTSIGGCYAQTGVAAALPATAAVTGAGSFSSAAVIWLKAA